MRSPIGRSGRVYYLWQSIEVVGSRESGESAGEVDRIEDDSAVYMFPSFKLALEHWLTDWFCVRGGSQAKFFGQTDSTWSLTLWSPTPQRPIHRPQPGLFWDWDQASRLRVQWTFQDGMMVEGPYLFSGKEGGLFVLTSLAYAF